MPSSSPDAALLQEIQRLSGAISRHKHFESHTHSRTNFYHPYDVNPAITNKKYPAGVNKKYVNPTLANHSSTSGNASNGKPFSSPTRELIINGVTFETSRRKLTRKDFNTNKSETSGPSGPGMSADTSSASTSRPQPPFNKKSGNFVASTRINKFGKRKRLGGRNNIVLDNVKGTRTGQVPKRRKVDKQCGFFTKTGTCQRGLTCRYQHDPEKIAICPQFLTGTCTNTAETCSLSHDPTPARVPVCHHFADRGRCTRENCPYPHVRVGPRNGVCRDFAVVGYCDKGIDCDHQHVRECPDFAENGVCPKARCKLPHVIRANRRRKHASAPQPPQVSSARSTASAVAKEVHSSSHSTALPDAHITEPAAPGAAEDYIPLTFEESDDEGDEESEEEEDSEEGEDDELSVDNDIMD